MPIMPPHPRFLLVRLIDHQEPREKTQAQYEEAAALIRTYGGLVAAECAQNAVRRDATTYIGKGKTQEVARLIEAQDIHIVVINDNIKSSQLFALQQIFERSRPTILVWDRTDLILEIFKKHATTAEAKLQIKLASIRHKGPELQGLGKLMSQQGAGIGTRGMGETNTEIMQRHWRSEIKNIETQLEKVRLSRVQQMERRKKTGFATISIIGYTNAGKTTLFNRLTNKNNIIANAPFATLDSSVGTLYLPEMEREAFVTDTIGFIENLPMDLVEAFKSTLMETVHADLLLQVIDMTDPWVTTKIEVVEAIVQNLAIKTTKQVYVFNKMDRAQSGLKAELASRYGHNQPQFVNALSGEGEEALIRAIQQELGHLHSPR